MNMSDNLELKHLAPYLPYGLDWVTKIGKVFKSETKDSFEIRIIKGNSPNGNKQYHSLTLGKIRRGEFKPILRPLSDLKGKEKDKIGYDCYKWISVNDISEVKYFTFEYLVSNHFDVFGLIEKGLAIDINSLTK